MSIIRHEIRQISDENRGQPIISQAVVHGNVAYFAGITPNPIVGDVKSQTAQVLRRVDELLKLAGTDKSHLLSAQDNHALGHALANARTYVVQFLARQPPHVSCTHSCKRVAHHRPDWAAYSRCRAPCHSLRLRTFLCHRPSNRPMPRFRSSQEGEC